MQKLYIGNEPFLSLKKAHLQIKELLKDGNLEYILIDGEKTDSSKIADLLTSKSLFSLPRVIFLKRAYKNKDRSNLIPYILEFLEKETTDSIIMWEDEKISSVTKYVKYFKNKKCLEEYNKLTKPSFYKYTKELLKESDIEMSSELVTLLSQYSNYDIERIENSIKKLKLLGVEGYVTKGNIDEISQNTLEEDIWLLLDEMNRREGRPLSVLENIFAQRVDPLYILPMITRNFRLIALTKYLTQNNATYAEIASTLKIPPFTVKPLIEASEKYDWNKILNKYEKLSNLDYEIKVGRIDSKLGLTLFCTTI